MEEPHLLETCCGIATSSVTMSALDVLGRLAETSIINANLRYCLVNENKIPFKIDGTPARSNIVADFVSFDDLLQCVDIDSYAGVGLSIQASNICAIDVDHCFSVKNDVNSADARAKFVIDLFKDVAYLEFSFSGTGLRVLFRHSIIDNYSKTYYIKNQSNGIEYYQPTQSNRYVTITGNVISDNMSNVNVTAKLLKFLNTYMLRPVIVAKHINKVEEEEHLTFDDAMCKVRVLFMHSFNFQQCWFLPAPGSGSNESERDFYLLSTLYEQVTTDKDLLKRLFESSPFFKSKDGKHLHKWEYNDFRYFNYLYDRIADIH